MNSLSFEPRAINPTLSAGRSALAKIFHACLLVLSFSLARADDRIDLPVRVNGQLMRFAFDSGAGVPVVIWQDVSQMMGLKTTPPPDGPSAPGQVRFAMSEPAELEFLGNKFPAKPLAVIRAPDYAKWEFQGLVGWPALRNNVLVFNFARGGVTMSARVPEEAEGWLKLPVTKNREVLVLEIPQEDGPAGELVIDSGDSGGVSLSPKLWAAWKAGHPDAPATLNAAFMLATGVSASEVTVAPEWSAGPLTLTNVLLQEAHPSHVAMGGERYLATLGYDALRKLLLIVDAKNGWAYLKPHNDSPAPGTYNRLGAVFLPANEKDDFPLVARVIPGSPAAEAGLRDGDRLLKVNGIDLAHWRKRPGTWPLSGFFERAPGTRINLAAGRGKETVSARTVLQNILSPKTTPHPAFDAALPLDFHFVPPLADLVRQGNAADIPTGPITLAHEPGPMRKGDSVTALITCVDGDKFQQSLVLFTASDLKPEEAKAARKQPTLFTTSGRTVNFDPAPAAIAIHVVGPLDANGKKGKAHDEWSGTVVTREFLTLGLDSTALAMKKLGSVRGTKLGFNAKPYPEKESLAARAKLETAGIVEADERAFVGGVMAIADFFRLAAQTPGVRDVLRQMVDISWKDFLKSPQINIHLQAPAEELNPALWGLPPGSACRSFRFRVELNGVPRLVCRVVATEPRRPLQTVAGVVGLVASRPDGSGPHVMVRVLSARPAENAPAK